MLPMISGFSRMSSKLAYQPTRFSSSQILRSYSRNSKGLLLHHNSECTKSREDFTTVHNTCLFQKPTLQYRSFWQQNRNMNSNAYSSFGAKLWYYRTFIVGGVLIVVVYVYWNRDTVEISGRVRMIDVSRSTELSMGEEATEELLKQFGNKVLPPNHRHTVAVRNVGNRIVAASGIPALQDLNWRFYVVQHEQANAFVLPNGAVWVFTGILPIMKDEGGMATVLSHEIAHVVARHTAERMSVYRLVGLFSLLLRLIGLPVETDLLLVFGIERPHSRATETEADHIGLLLMSRACYDPRKSVELWKRMHDLERKRGMDNVLFKYVSTHPLGSSRAQKLEEWMPEAIKETSHCTKLRSAVALPRSTIPTFQNIPQPPTPVHRPKEHYEEEQTDDYSQIFGREEHNKTNEEDDDW